VPAPRAGRIVGIHAKVGDRVSEGTLIVSLEEAGGADAPSAAAPAAQAAPPPAAPAPAAKPATGSSDLHAEVLVLGAGPGGYTAAFRAA
ncbi:hypothetical protein ACKI14_49350, partial [Streptomyces turgidiscabies]